MVRAAFVAFLLGWLVPTLVWAQTYSFLSDEKGLDEVKKITQLIYNNKHQQVEAKLESLRQSVPLNHPVHPMLQAINLYWKDAPMQLASPYYPPFEKMLHQTIKHAEAYLEKEQDVHVSLFCTLTAHSLLTRFYSEKGVTMNALKEARQTYAYIKEGFELKDEYNEFYFSTGLFNYYRVKYPELHPAYKPFMWFFQEGDKSLGLQQLEYASRNTVFTKVEAASFLVHLYLYYENLPQKALANIRPLYSKFRQNRYLRLQLTESLLAAHQYEEAFAHIAFLHDQESPYYRFAAELFSGIVAEKHQQDYSKAFSHYTRALIIAESLPAKADTYRSMVYAGLARYYEAKNQEEKARSAWQQALKLARYDYPVKQEAKKKLK